jgi:hypothetical protein
VDPTLLGVSLFAAGLVIAFVLGARARWLVLAGALGAFTWWVVEIAQGCNHESEVRCAWQPALGFIVALFFFSLWSGGVFLGSFARGRLRR